MTHLFDANALIALGWPAHEHHEIMQSWFARHARRGWSTCALTQAAFVRIVSQPAFAGRPLSVGEVAALLTAAIRSGVKLLTFEAGIRHLLATEAERERHLTVMA